ncbi:MAG TPA: pantoate--beta-alanine ligase [Acidimicrobiales bacterium]|nr:pantoate--beta-alanine ligase [Acidimicrobiales bacterium]
MQVHETIDGFRKALDAERAAGRTVGLVPTMGFLHAGHASLMARAAAECDIAAATIFVNPLQFAPHEDLDAYPRDIEGDLATASAAGVAHAFTPSLNEMFPGEVATSIHVTGVSEAMEGASRPGHFDGVATVVAKLFAIAGPCRAYFGEKDYQQLAVIRRMVDDLALPVTVVACETVRDATGLALSSRNAYLSDDERRAAAVLSRALRAGLDLIAAGVRDADAVRVAIVDEVEGEPRADLDYAAVVDAATLRPIQQISGEVRLLVAARVGATRLIDNAGASA